MAGYSDGEAAILTRVRACSGYTAANTARSNWKLLNQGKSDFYAILRPGPFEVVFQTLGSYSVRWTTVIEVWQRYSDDATTQSNLYTRMQALMAILQYPHLGSTFEDSQIAGGDDPQEMWTSGGGPAWLKWEMRVGWTETINITFAE